MEANLNQLASRARAAREPQSQGGRRAAASLRAAVTPEGNDGQLTRYPAPAPHSMSRWGGADITSLWVAADISHVVLTPLKRLNHKGGRQAQLARRLWRLLRAAENSSRFSQLARCARQS